MSVVKVQSNASNTGIFTVQSPDSSSDRTLTLPDANGTLTYNDSRDIVSAQFRINPQTLDTNTTIASTENALCAGPLVVASGVTLTVASGGRLAIV